MKTRCDIPHSHEPALLTSILLYGPRSVIRVKKGRCYQIRPVRHESDRDWTHSGATFAVLPEHCTYTAPFHVQSVANGLTSRVEEGNRVGSPKTQTILSRNSTELGPSCLVTHTCTLTLRSPHPSTHTLANLFFTPCIGLKILGKMN